MVTVKQAAGDYSSLKAAIDANETTIDIEGTWTVDDNYTGSCVIDAGNATTITCDSDSRNLAYPHIGVGTWYRLRKTDSGHMFTLNDDLTMFGVDAQHEAAAISDEIFRVSTGGIAVDLDSCGMGYDEREGNGQCDVFLVTVSGAIDLVVTNCWTYNADRAVWSLDDVNNSGSTIDINSCASYDCGVQFGTLNRWQAYVGISGSNDVPVRVFNCAISHGEGTASGAVFQHVGATSTILVNDTIINLADMASGWSTETVTGSTLSATWTENLAPGIGDFVIVEDITSTIQDLRLGDSSENDAQDAHANATGAGLTMPATDCAGAPRPRNIDYDIGHFEVPTINFDVCTSGSWSSTVSFADCDQLSLELDGPATNDIRASVTIEFTNA